MSASSMVDRKGIEPARGASPARLFSSGAFAGSISAENADVFDDVDVIVTYGDQAMIDSLKADPMLGLMPAIANDAVVLLDGSTAEATAANPTPLQLPYLLDWYVSQLVTAAEKSQP